MLSRLRIKNIALIDEHELELQPGFTVLTGETGAGKSIILDAVQLLLGGQANEGYIKHGADEALVEGTFIVPPNPLWESYVGDTGTLLITRKLQRGKDSVARINGETVPLKVLKTLGPHLVSIMSQHEAYSLYSKDHQRQLLDTFAKPDITPLLNAYTTAYDQFMALKTQLKHHQDAQNQSDQHQAFLSFQIQDIEQHHLKPGEDEALETQKQQLKQVAKQQAARSTLLGPFEEALSLLEGVSKQLTPLNLPELEPAQATLADELDTLHALYATLDRNLAIPNLDLDIDTLEARLDTLFKLKTKYKAQSIDALLNHCTALKTELHNLLHAEEVSHNLEEQLQKAKQTLLDHGKKLQALRAQKASILSQTIQRTLVELDFEKAKFTIELSPTPPTTTGLDAVTFMMSPNPGEPLKPLDKIASGGELSRIMLALKAVFTSDAPIETLIFDEIDTGVGGLTANRIGEKLRAISQQAPNTQLVAITHLAQIATVADHHIVVQKKVSGEKTITTLQTLNPNQKRQELERMIGGKAIAEILISPV
ncbi:MAG: DNA repair protein RecN [Candidatus Margulisiibacteriota bacterium]